MDSAFKKDQNYYLEDFSEECQYIEKKVVRHIIDDLKGFSDDSNYSEVLTKSTLKIWSKCYTKKCSKMHFSANNFENVSLILEQTVNSKGC